MYEYDYLIVGSGLSGAVFAEQAKRRGKRCLVLEKRSHIGGNVYDEKHSEILVQRYGAHIFHTNEEKIWQYFNKFSKFNRFINSPLANYKGAIYNLSFNMNTFNKLWGVVTPAEAIKKIELERVHYDYEPKNLEEQALSLVGWEIYEKLVKGYTEKQWGRDCEDLPSFIIKRLPLRFTYDNNYFNDTYQGLPEGGYTELIKKLLNDVEVRLNVDYLQNRSEWSALGHKVVYTGMIDAYFDYIDGPLEYRSLHFEDSWYESSNYQGAAVVNYTDRETPYTRSIEHKHFYAINTDYTIVTKEYSLTWQPELEPYYPINDETNQKRYIKYKKRAASLENVYFLGRLAEYTYRDMGAAAMAAMNLADTII